MASADVIVVLPSGALWELDSGLSGVISERKFVSFPFIIAMFACSCYKGCLLRNYFIQYLKANGLYSVLQLYILPVPGKIRKTM